MIIWTADGGGYGAGGCCGWGYVGGHVGGHVGGGVGCGADGWSSGVVMFVLDSGDGRKVTCGKKSPKRL